jgi:hypothetical protein
MLFLVLLDSLTLSTPFFYFIHFLKISFFACLSNLHTVKKSAISSYITLYILLHCQGKFYQCIHFGANGLFIHIFYDRPNNLTLWDLKKETVSRDFRPSVFFIQTAEAASAASLKPQKQTISNEYLEFLGELEAICETALARESGL